MAMWWPGCVQGSKGHKGASTQKAWCLLHPHLYSTPAPAALGPCITALVGISHQ